MKNMFESGNGSALSHENGPEKQKSIHIEALNIGDVINVTTKNDSEYSFKVHAIEFNPTTVFVECVAGETLLGQKGILTSDKITAGRQVSIATKRGVAHTSKIKNFSVVNDY